MPEDFPQTVAKKWQALYSGSNQVEAEIVDYELPVDAPALQAVVVRAPDFRHDPGESGNWPKIFHHGRPTNKVLVLIHGLTDSPCYVEAIGLRFALHGEGANVLMPLLPGHGREDPGAAMERADYTQWRQTVDAAVDLASAMGAEVSIGGFSTGGALSVDKAVRSPDLIDGKVFLFSGALDLANVEKLFLGTHVSSWVDAIKEGKTDNKGIGGDPCKYSRMFMSGAAQLERLIKEMRKTAVAEDGFANFRHRNRVFVAHSEADETIDWEAVAPLVIKADPGQHLILPKSLGVGHSELVLDRGKAYTTVFPDEKDPPKANPEFERMIQLALQFMDRPARADETR